MVPNNYDDQADRLRMLEMLYEREFNSGTKYRFICFVLLAISLLEAAVILKLYVC